MKRYWTVIGLVLLFFLCMFLLAEQFTPSVLGNPYDLLGVRGISAALIGIALLVADVVLPVPSSLIMIANGALFGVGVGAALSILGSLGAGLAGFFIGRHGGQVLNRFVPAEEQHRANHMLNEWGVLAIIVTRPIPLLAETTAIMAGASPMRWRSMVLATLAGSVPVAVLYALTGATAANLDNGILAFGVVLLVASLFWLARYRFRGGFSSRPDVR